MVSVLSDSVRPYGREEPVGGKNSLRLLVALQLLLFVLGAGLTALWIGGSVLGGAWWSNLPMVGFLLASLFVFSYEEATLGRAGKVREEKGEPESMGGALEAVAFVTWLFLLTNMIATVFKVIRAIKRAV